MSVYILKDANATHQSTVNDAVVNVTPYTQQLLYQFIGVVQPSLTNLLLNDLVADHTEVRAVC